MQLCWVLDIVVGMELSCWQRLYRRKKIMIMATIKIAVIILCILFIVYVPFHSRSYCFMGIRRFVYALLLGSWKNMGLSCWENEILISEL